MLKCLNVKMNKGFTVIEVIVAIFVIVAGIAGVLNLITQTISSVTVSSQKLTAAYLAQEGIEIVRNIRDTNWLEQYTDSTNSWNEGLTACGLGCEADYVCTTVEDPDPANPPSHYCLASYDSGHFLKIDTNNLYNYASGTETRFKRKITISSAGDILKVTAEVFLEDESIITVKENLYNWKP